MNILTKENARAGTNGVIRTGYPNFTDQSAKRKKPGGGFYHYLPADVGASIQRRLPDAEAYYRSYVKKLGRANQSGWAQGCCPFHEDSKASLSVNLDHGGWRCFAGCGSGDLIAFHGRLIGLGFRDALADLTEVRT